MVTADVKPSTLHLKPEHYKLLATHKMPIVSSKDELSSVISIVVHGSCDLPPAEKQKLNDMFPNLQHHTFLKGEYYEYHVPSRTASQATPRRVNFERQISSSLSSISRTSSESSSNDDFLSVKSSE